MTGDAVTVNSGAVWPEDAADVEEAMLVNWFAREGAHVEEGETICEIQIEKVSVDVPAPASGTLAEHLVPEDEVFRRGDALAKIERD